MSKKNPRSEFWLLSQIMLLVSLLSGTFCLTWIYYFGRDEILNKPKQENKLDAILNSISKKFTHSCPELTDLIGGINSSLKEKRSIIVSDLEKLKYFVNFEPEKTIIDNFIKKTRERIRGEKEKTKLILVELLNSIEITYENCYIREITEKIRKSIECGDDISLQISDIRTLSLRLNDKDFTTSLNSVAISIENLNSQLFVETPSFVISKLFEKLVIILKSLFFKSDEERKKVVKECIDKIVSGDFLEIEERMHFILEGFSKDSEEIINLKSLGRELYDLTGDEKTLLKWERLGLISSNSYYKVNKIFSDKNRTYYLGELKEIIDWIKIGTEFNEELIEKWGKNYRPEQYTSLKKAVGKELVVNDIDYINWLRDEKNIGIDRLNKEQFINYKTEYYFNSF